MANGVKSMQNSSVAAILRFQLPECGAFNPYCVNFQLSLTHKPQKLRLTHFGASKYESKIPTTFPS